MSYFGSIYADQELSHRAKTVYMYLKARCTVRRESFKSSAILRTLGQQVSSALERSLRYI